MRRGSAKLSLHRCLPSRSCPLLFHACLFVFHLLLLSLPPEQVDSSPCLGPCCIEVMNGFQCLLLPSPVPPPLSCGSALLLPSLLGRLSLCTAVPLQSRRPWALAWCWMEAVGCYFSLNRAVQLGLYGKLNHLREWKLIYLSTASNKVIGTS